MRYLNIDKVYKANSTQASPIADTSANATSIIELLAWTLSLPEAFVTAAATGARLGPMGPSSSDRPIQHFFVVEHPEPLSPPSIPFEILRTFQYDGRGHALAAGRETVSPECLKETHDDPDSLSSCKMLCIQR
ncbi:MAG: hypothetical protein M1821_008229 [Bathelium mastoideum]|nr:MAG: hypothetical protein M1821_008229 [Bathelium mastoideum]